MGDDLLERKPLTAKGEALQLIHHGTRAFAMTPAMVVQAAAQDIASYAHNLRVKAERKAEKVKTDGHPKQVDPARPLAFLPKHVRGKTTPSAVIGTALGDLASGVGSKEPNTARLYNDADLLRAALDLATHTTP